MEINLNNPIAERKTKTVYTDNGKTIKLFVQNYAKSNILNEALNQARVEEGTDLNIPKLLEVSKIEDRWAIISEYIEGTPLNVLMQQNPDKENEYLNLFVDTQIKILSNSVPLLNRIKDKFKRKLINATNIDENIKYELLQRLEGMKNHEKLCHGDFNPSNLIIKEDGSVYIIDWAHVTRRKCISRCSKNIFTIFNG
jgi:RIO-like serine/threonine protein kinase